MIAELAVYRGAGFRKLPFVLFLLAIAVTVPFVLAWAAYTRVRAWLRGPPFRASPRALYVGRHRYEAPVMFEVEALYGGGGRIVAHAENLRIELPTGPLSYAEADSLAATLIGASTPSEEEGRYR